MPEDPYVDARGVLHNKLGITDASVLALAEGKFAAVRDAQLANAFLPGAYDLDHLRAFHRHLFQDVYSWAGMLRTVDIGKGDVWFCKPEFIEARANDTVFRLVVRHSYLGNCCTADALAETLAELLGEINALHPFREGNGRTQRAFFRQMAASAGWRVDWFLLDAAANVAASKSAMLMDYTPLADLLRPLVSPI